MKCMMSYFILIYESYDNEREIRRECKHRSERDELFLIKNVCDARKKIFELKT